MYHRVAELESDPWSMTIKPKHFAEQMQIIQKYGNPMPLKQLINKMNVNEPLQRAVVVTFDDGYKDNLYTAKPILEKYNIPATVFVATGGLDQQREFWWDELDRLLLQTGRLPGLLQLRIRGKSYEWKLDETAYPSRYVFKLSGHWSMGRKLEKVFNRRKNLYSKIYKLLQFLSENERERVLEELRIWANIEPLNQSVQLPLSKDDLFALEKGGLVEIGAHTESHPHLSKIPVTIQKDEIQNSKAYLENILGHNVNSFAYPHGSYNKDTISIVKEAGFNCACSSIFGRVKRNNNLYLLPRFVVKDWDGETFSRWLSRIAW